MHQPSTSSNAAFLPDQGLLKKRKPMPELASKGFPFAEPFICDNYRPADAQVRPKREDPHVPFGLHFARQPNPDTIAPINLEGAYYDPAQQVYQIEMSAQQATLRWRTTRRISSYATTISVTSLDSVSILDTYRDPIVDTENDSYTD